jgi:hypothetical protein
MTGPETDAADGPADHDLEYHAPSTGNKALFEVYEASVATGSDTGKFGDLVAKVWTPGGGWAFFSSSSS